MHCLKLLRAVLSSDTLLPETVEALTTLPRPVVRILRVAVGLRVPDPTCTVNDQHGARDTIPHRYRTTSTTLAVTLHAFSARTGKLVGCIGERNIGTES
jgi:hypothetical protein